MITPVFQRIVDDIRAQIAAGSLKPGDKLPTMEELRKQYATSSRAVRDAMLTLRAEKLIEGQQGKGVYVAQPPNKESPG